jgi:16S rRNA (cytosine967-C5)-methyltransferase
LAIALVKINSVSPARLAAFEILRRVEAGAYASVLLAAGAAALKPVDRALCHDLVLGVLRRQLWLDRLIELYANRQVVELDPAVRAVLRLGLYQLRFQTRVPASAAVNESVNLVYFARKRSAAGLVNAVLRRATREPDVDPAANIFDPGERLAVEASHPAWLLDRWTKAFGFAQAAAFARANNEPAPVAFRVVSKRARAGDVLASLQEAGAEVVESLVAQHAWRVSGAGTLLSKLVSQGKIYLQDEASQLVAAALDVRPGLRVLDLCAAPGSKATQIADLAMDSAMIIAGDLYQHRLNTVFATAQAQDLKSIQCIVLDGLATLPFAAGSFDRVLVDAPCSGTGTMRRNPEIRWRISPADLTDLSGRQQRLLANAATAVKPGGHLIYSTCSVELEENEDVVQTFLENNKYFQSIQLPLSSRFLLPGGGARTWPHRDGTDGFFISAFRRTT